jgi:hypothetical protein
VGKEHIKLIGYTCFISDAQTIDRDIIDFICGGPPTHCFSKYGPSFFGVALGNVKLMVKIKRATLSNKGIVNVSVGFKIKDIFGRRVIERFFV